MGAFEIIVVLVIVFVVFKIAKKAVKNSTDTQENVPKTTHDTLKDKCLVVDQTLNPHSSLEQKQPKKDSKKLRADNIETSHKVLYDAKKAKHGVLPVEKDAYNKDETSELLTNWEKGIIFSEILSKPKALRK